LPRDHSTRFIPVQRNLPGELQRPNEVYAKHKVNIAAQYYQTDGEIGYLVRDCDDLLSGARDILAELRQMPGTVRARLFYRKI
jgi:D-3-phosphoglycerate dehydrogenase